jgi:hypothetical protein
VTRTTLNHAVSKLSSKRWAPIYYPSDVIHIDQYGTWTTLEDLQSAATVSQHPAVKAGQAGPWLRNLPLTYQGLTTFLESVLESLRNAEKVS